MAQSYHILAVDDEAMIRELIRKYAEFQGYTVDEAQDGMEAVEKCRKNNASGRKSKYFAECQ